MVLKTFAAVMLLAVLPIGSAFAGGRGGALLGVAPTTGAVEGAPAGAMAPGLNSLGAGSLGNGSNEPGISRPSTKGDEFGGGYGNYSTGIAPAPPPSGGASPPGSTAASQPNPSDSKQGGSISPRESVRFQGLTGDQPISSAGLSRPGPDGVSTVIVQARACGVAAHETDGTTTCVGIPKKRRR